MQIFLDCDLLCLLLTLQRCFKIYILCTYSCVLFSIWINYIQKSKNPQGKSDLLNLYKQMIIFKSIYKLFYSLAVKTVIYFFVVTALLKYLIFNNACLKSLNICLFKCFSFAQLLILKWKIAFEHELLRWACSILRIAN